MSCNVMERTPIYQNNTPKAALQHKLKLTMLHVRSCIIAQHYVSKFLDTTTSRHSGSLWYTVPCINIHPCLICLHWYTCQS